MSNEVITKIDEVFGNPENFSTEGLNSLIYEIFKLFNELKAKIASPDESERQKAIEMCNELKTKLEEQAASLCKVAGIDPQNLETFVSNPDNFLPNEWETLQSTKSELETFKTSLNK